MLNTIKRALAVSAIAALTTGALLGNALAQDTLRVGMPSQMFLNLPEFVAQEQGFYEDQNLDVELVHIADSSVPVRSMIAGELDVSQTGMSETLAAVDKGAALRTIGGVNTGLHYGLYVGADSGIEAVEDMVGKRVGISSPGSLPHVVIMALLQEAGVSEEDIDTI